MRDLAERMHALFRGHEGAHGTYEQEDRSHGRDKVEIKRTARTLREPPTDDLWEQHILGRRALGIVPISESGECIWGVIDVDSYDLSHQEIAKKIEKMNFPMVVCRSKSGGAHLFVFLRSPMPASDLMAKLREIAACLGFGTSEIFPKQTEVKSERGDIGNWLNMPYFKADGGDRYAVTSGGKGMSLERFLEWAERIRLPPDSFLGLRTKIASEDDDLRDGPPCLQYLAGTGVSEGGRNNALFAYGVLAKKKHPDNWEPVLERWNHKFINPPLSSEEVQIIVRSLRKKDYSYKCKDSPINAHCDAVACRLRTHGVGQGSAPDISSVSILDTEPPLFFVTLSSGATVECSSDDILSSRSFQRAALDQLKIMLPLYKQDNWLSRIALCLESATRIEAPRESGVTGAFHALLEDFCTNKYRAKERDEIILGKPWLDEDQQLYWFRLQDLEEHLNRVKFRELTRNKMTQRIRQLGGMHRFFNLRGKGLNLWSVPAEVFEVQTEPHSVPRVEESPI